MKNSFRFSLFSFLWIFAFLLSFNSLSQTEDENNNLTEENEINSREERHSRFRTKLKEGADKIRERFSKRRREEAGEEAYRGWNNVVGDLGHEIDKLTKQEDLALFLFQELGTSQGQSFGLYNENFDAPSVLSNLPVTAGISLNLNRSVIDNKNVRGTYSVVDRIIINFSPSAYFRLTGIPLVSGSIGGGPRFSFEVFNIRNVGHGKYSDIIPLRKVKNWFQKYLKKSIAKKIIKRDDSNTIGDENRRYLNFMPRLSKYMPEKNEIREAYLGRLWNPISQAFRLPLTLKSVNRMEKNEILAYALSGGVVLGATFGTNLDPTGYLSILRVHGADINFSISGKHQISILKEAPKKRGDNFVRLKLSRIRPKGVSFGMGSSAVTPLHKWITLNGNIVWTTLGGIVQLRPYRFQINKALTKFYDVAYRFNLNKAKGREAYLLASIGDLTLADVYSSDNFLKISKENKSNRSVEKLFTKKQKQNIRNIEQMVKLFFIELKKKRTFSDTFKWIKIKGEVHKYFETDVLSEKKLMILFGFHKNRSHRFTINVDLNTFGKKSRPLDSLTLLVRASYKDDFIPARRYVRYVDEIETALDQKDFLPLPPINSKKKTFIKGPVGRLNLSYSLKIKRKSLEKFIDYPEKKMWPALIKAFGATGKSWETRAGRAKWIAARLAVYGLTIPLSALGIRLPEKDDILIAKMKYSRWKKIKEFKNNPEKLSHALGKFFESGDYGPEMVRILRIVLVGEKIAINGSFRSDLLGKGKDIKIGKTDAWSDPTAGFVGRSFDNYRPNFKGIKTSGTHAKIVGQAYFKVNFHLEKKPKKVFFKLELKNLLGIFNNKTLETLVIENKDGLFKKGLNSFIFYLTDKKHILYPLAKPIKFYKFGFMGNKYRISIASSEDGIHFGDVSSHYFRARPLYHKSKLKSLRKLTQKQTLDCLGKTSDELIFYLDRMEVKDHLICLQKSAREKDGRCKKGLPPYIKIPGMVDKNRKKRNNWIIEHCPKVIDKEDIKRLVNRKDSCRGKKYKDILKEIGNDIFYVCDYWHDEKKEKGFCKDGVIPYMYDDLLGKKHGENIKSRNTWLEKNCL